MRFVGRGLHLQENACCSVIQVQGYILFLLLHPQTITLHVCCLLVETARALGDSAGVYTLRGSAAALLPGLHDCIT